MELLRELKGHKQSLPPTHSSVPRLGCGHSLFLTEVCFQGAVRRGVPCPRKKQKHGEGIGLNRGHTPRDSTASARFLSGAHLCWREEVPEHHQDGKAVCVRNPREETMFQRHAAGWWSGRGDPQAERKGSGTWPATFHSAGSVPGVSPDLKAPQSGHLDFWLSIHPSGR